MRHIIKSAMILLLALVCVGTATAAGKGKKKNTTQQPQVVYTGEIGKKVIGYNGPTPLKITIERGKIAAIEVQDNQEGPQYLQRATAKVFPQFIGKTVAQGLALEADAATGATYTSEALIKNIRLGLQQVKQPAAAGKNKTAKTAKGKKRMTRK